MQRRVFSAFVCLFYLGVSLMAGALHEHNDDSHSHSPCAACSWQSTHVSDVPVAHCVPVRAEALVESMTCDDASIPAPFLTDFHGRAPPIAAL